MIPESAFKETQNLKHIDLYKNPNLIIDGYNPFKYVKNLEHLDIAMCGLVTKFIDVSMPKLKELVMYESQVSFLVFF